MSRTSLGGRAGVGDVADAAPMRRHRGAGCREGAFAERDAAVVGFGETRDQAQQGGLAGAVHAHDAPAFGATDEEAEVLVDDPAAIGLVGLLDAHDVALPMSATTPLLTPIVMTIPLQLLAYHIAEIKGNDVDQPRNLAKSVTVE